MIPRSRIRLACAAASVLLLSCTTPTGMCACPASRTHAVAFGIVRTAAGAPVAGATVDVGGYRETCGDGWLEPNAYGGAPAKTDASGAYEVQFFSMSGPRTACLRLRATTAPGDSAVHEGATVPMVHEGEKPHRVQVDLVFPSR